MRSYFVIVKDSDDGNIFNTVCNSQRELSDFVTHIDAERYQIENISIIKPLMENKEFYKKNKDLETGGSND